MLRSRKSIIWTSAILVTIILCIAGIIFLSSTSYKVLKIEFEWNIDLPNQMKLDYEDKEVHIDGSVHYYVFTIKDEPSDEVFTMSEEINKDDFETLFTRALEGFGVSSDKPNIPIEYLPNFDVEYKFLVLSGVTSNRFKFLYVMYQPSTNKLYICNQVSQLLY